ncbi:DNA-directed DNA polymerase [Tanacetum coccineum]
MIGLSPWLIVWPNLCTQSTLDDGHSTMKVEELVDVGTEVEKINAMDVVENVSKKVKHEVVVFTKTPYRYANTLRYVRLDYGDYRRKMVKEIQVGIHRYNVETDFVVVDYVNDGEPSIVFGRSFPVTTKSQVDFGLGEMRIDVTMLKEEMDVDTLLENLVEDMIEVGATSGKLVKMGKANCLKSYNALERKYQELEEKKSIVEVLKKYMMYEKELDKVVMGRARLESKDHTEEDRERVLENGLPKKMSDPGNFVLPIGVNGNPRPYHSNLTMANNTQAKAMGEVRNVRIQIGYQAYLADFLVLDISVDKELPLLLGRPFLRTCGAMIDIGRGTMTNDDGVIKHTYYPKPRAKSYFENFEIDEDEDLLSCFEVGDDIK